LFLVAVNPYKKLPLYGEDVVRAYKGKKRSEASPHIFAIADNAYSDMLQDKENQSILITGESGAGKTENTKKVIQYLTSIACNKKGTLGALEHKILQANPILESFGNAQTVRNNNSSRFGKFIRLEFNPTGHIVGANIERYLLEKSRVTHQSSKERNYHIFYQLLRGASPELKKDLLLDGTLNDYAYTKSSKKDIDLVNDAAEFKSLQDAMSVMKFTAEEKRDLFKMIAAILHLGNIEVVPDREDQAKLTERGQKVVEKFCHLVGISVTDFTKGLLRPKIKAGRDWVVQARDVSQVEYSMEALARAMYERMFSALIERINEELGSCSSKATFIGVLDIAGFEIFERNGFEQFCINYTNEKLQQFFNHHMFVMEQEEYRSEGIDWKFIDFGLDLQPTIDLIEKTSPVGILSCLDEECVMPKATDKTFNDKLSGLWKGKSSKFAVPRFNKGFILNHYAGRVEYDTNSWLDKNKDPLNENITKLLAGSSDKYMACLFSDFASDPDDTTASGGGGGFRPRGITRRGAFRTVAQRHKEQLVTLMSQLAATEPHFVRCILPNNEKRAGRLDAPLVLDQLRCNGVLEGIRICRAGFPNRLSFADFRHRYEMLAPRAIPQGFMGGRSGTQLLLEALAVDPNLYRIGTSKVFFKTGVLAELEEQRDVRLTSLVVKIQAVARGYIARRLFKRRLDQCRAIRIIQRNARVYVALREWSWWKLYAKIKPLLNVTRVDEELRRKDQLLRDFEERSRRDQDDRARLEAFRQSLETEKRIIEDLLVREKNAAADQSEILARVQTREAELAEQLAAAQTALEDREAEIERFVSLRDQLQADARAAAEAVEAARAHADRGDRERAQRDDAIRSMEAETRQTAAVMQRLEAEKRALETQLLDAQASVDSYSAQLAAAEQAHARFKAANAELEQKAERDADEARRLERRVATLERAGQESLEALADVTRARSELESNLRRRETELTNIAGLLAEEKSERDRADVQKRELAQALQSLQAELEAERLEKDKLARARRLLQDELDAMAHIIEEKGSAETKQVELRRVRENEVNYLKSQLAGAVLDLENHKKLAAVSTDKLKIELEAVRGDLAASQKSRAALETQLSGAHANTERLEEANARLEKSKRQLEADLTAARSQCAEAELQAADVRQAKEVLESKYSTASARLEASEADCSRLEREKAGLARQAELFKEELETASQKAAGLDAQRRRVAAELADAKVRADEDEEARAELTRRLAGKSQELEAVRERLASESAASATELDDARRRHEREAQELRETVATMEKSVAGLDKTKARLTAEVEDLHLELDRACSAQRAAEKMARALEGQLQAAAELAEAERRQRELGEGAVRKLQATCDSLAGELQEKTQQLAALSKGKADLEMELKALIGEVGDNGKNVHELDRARRRLEARVQELELMLDEELVRSQSLEDQKAALEAAALDTKRQHDAEMQAKDAILDETRRMLMKEVNALGEELDDVSQQKADLAKQKKRLEDLVDELESRAENTAKGQTEMERAKKRADTAVRELQAQLEEAERLRRNVEELGTRHERRANQLQMDVELAAQQLEQSERARKALERRVEELDAALQAADDGRAAAVDSVRRLEAEVQQLQVRLEEEEEQRSQLESVRQQGSADVEQARTREALEEKIEQLEESRRALLATQRLAAQEHDDRAKDLANMDKQRRLLQAEIDDMRQRLEGELAAKCDEAAARRRVQNEAKDLQMRLEVEAARCADLADSVNAYKLKADQLAAKLEAAELARMKAEKGEAGARAQLKEAEETLEALSQERRAADERTRALEDRHA
ncbi:hypothetical protein HK405_004553, partial [Cladochytrium tenue]